MGSHHYVRFCIDGTKFHSSGAFNEMYTKDISTVAIGQGFPFDLFKIPSNALNKHMLIGSHFITFIFFKRHAANCSVRTIYKLCEIYIDYGIVTAIKTIDTNNVTVKKYRENYDVASYRQLEHILNL